MPIPRLVDSCLPPEVLGPAALTTAAMGGATPDALIRLIDAAAPAPPARLFDTAIAYQLGLRRAEALAVQQHALAASPLYRIRRAQPHPAPLRVLALCIPGDLMANTPLDFITNHLDVRLDLLFLTQDGGLPAQVPAHDIAFFAATESDPAVARTLRQLYAAWPRPVLNDPALLATLRRDALARALAGIPEILSPALAAVSRADLRQPIATLLAGAGYPVLLRPAGSHAGQGLRKLDGPDDLAAVLADAPEDDFYLSAFVDYRSADGLYRKYRIAFIDRAPYLCHMAPSDRWMVHYLNAGMDGSAAKRAEEARAMATFDTDFAARHASAFAALNNRLGLQYYAIDCAELPDGRLLVFEADTAAIIHAMDPPGLYPYKLPQMRRVFDAFGAMLWRVARQGQGALPPHSSHVGPPAWSQIGRTGGSAPGPALLPL